MRTVLIKNRYARHRTAAYFSVLNSIFAVLLLLYCVAYPIAAEKESEIRDQYYDVIEELFSNKLDRSNGDTQQLITAVEKNDVRTVKELLEYDVNVDSDIDWEGKSLLQYGAEHNQVEIARLLLEKGANVNLKNKRGETALHLAVLKSNFELARIVIENGADVNLRNYEGYSALHAAAATFNEEMVKMLIDSGANVNVKD